MEKRLQKARCDEQDIDHEPLECSVSALRGSRAAMANSIIDCGNHFVGVFVGSMTLF
jgi:hypothetical protein